VYRLARRCRRPVGGQFASVFVFGMVVVFPVMILDLAGDLSDDRQDAPGNRDDRHGVDERGQTPPPPCGLMQS